ncbi:MAG: polysaccharide export protein [Bryobacterales bacterium]|nr:polysaccharide export protein [Bryobacterales bacterium]
MSQAANSCSPHTALEIARNETRIPNKLRVWSESRRTVSPLMRKVFKRNFGVMNTSCIVLALLSGLFAATQQGTIERKPSGEREAAAEGQASLKSGYVLGLSDQIIVRAVNVEEISDKPIMVDVSGYVRLPMAGRIRVSGLTVAEVEAEITDRLKSYLLRPDVTVSIAEFRSQPVSVIGAVRNPAVRQMEGRKTLVEMLSLAGDLETTAGSTLKITRRLEGGRIPLPNSKHAAIHALDTATQIGTRVAIWGRP